MVSLLKQSYRNNIDYKIINLPSRKHKYGGNNYKKVLITPDCFKRIAMRSNSAKAEEVRSYYINLESLIMKYFEHMMQGMQEEINELEKAIKPKNKEDSVGYIYVVKASRRRRNAYKIGQTRNLNKRLSTYQTGNLEKIEVIFKWRTDRLQSVEKCVKQSLQEFRLRKYNEIYEANIDMIKKIIETCNSLQDIKEEYRAPSALTGGDSDSEYYIALVKI